MSKRLPTMCVESFHFLEEEYTKSRRRPALTFASKPSKAMTSPANLWRDQRSCGSGSWFQSIAFESVNLKVLICAKKEGRFGEVRRPRIARRFFPKPRHEGISPARAGKREGYSTATASLQSAC